MSCVSVIVPLYNGQRFVDRCITSVLNQTFTKFQLIIIDDASLDESVNLVTKYLTDSRVELYINEKNMGAAYTRNLGLSKAIFPLIAFLDCDDFWELDKLEVQVLFMQKNHCAISYGNYNIIDINNNYIKLVSNLPEQINYIGYLKNTIFGTSTTIINKEIAGEISFVNYRTRQDLILWLSILKNGHKAMLFPGVHVHYRIHNDSLSSNKIKAMYTVLKIYIYHEKLPLIEACYFFSFYVINALKKRYF